MWLSESGQALIVFGPAAQTPFGSIKGAEKTNLGLAVKDLLP